MTAQRPEPRNRLMAPLLGCGVIFVVVAVVAFVGFQWLKQRQQELISVPPANQCVVRVGDTTYSMTPEQSKYAAIITAESIRRGLPARAASIGLATAMQESSLRNLDYGDRDSVGLFQQRPSQGWGTVEQIMDPWYSAGKFYAELVKVKDWQTGDINDVAQKVQRSGVPDGYRKHVANAQALASALTGHSPAALRCVNRDQPETSNPQILTQVLTKGLAGKVTVTKQGSTWQLASKNPTLLWAAVQLSMATIDEQPVTLVVVAGKQWQHDPKRLAAWTTASPSATPVPSGGATISVG